MILTSNVGAETIKRQTTLGFGAMELRDAPRGPAVSEETAQEVLNAVLDAGINFIDTSPDYGLSEERIGRYISHRRSEYFLASKCGCAAEGFGTGAGNEHFFTAANVRAAVEQSLRRMRTDYLDIVQFHQSPSRAVMEAEGALAELQALQREGKVRFLGMSGVLPELREQMANSRGDVRLFDFGGNPALDLVAVRFAQKILGLELSLEQCDRVALLPAEPVRLLQTETLLPEL